MRGMRRPHAQRRGCPPRMGYPSKANERGLMAHHAYLSTHGTAGACERAAMCRLCPPASGACRARCDSNGWNGRCLLHVVCRMSHGVCCMCYHARFCVTGRVVRSERSNAQRARESARGVRVPRVPEGFTTGTTRHRPALPQLDRVVQLVLPIFARPPRRHHLSRRLVPWGALWATVGYRRVPCGSSW